jgi:putative ABC transport system permease protein
MSLLEFLTTLEIGLLYSLVAMGVYLSFRLIHFPDLTVDGSFTLGGAITALALTHFIPPIFALGFSLLAGMLAGMVTGLLSVRFKILNILASILTLISLYSINLRVMGKPNIALLDAPALFLSFHHFSYGLLAIIIGILLLLSYFFNTEKGLTLRAAGENTILAKSYGLPVGAFTIFILMLSNGLVALAGALFAIQAGFADQSMGMGTIIIGLAAVILGETFFPSRKIQWALLGCIVGSVLYRFLVVAALNLNFLGLQASDLNLLTAVLVGITFIISHHARKRRDLA